MFRALIPHSASGTIIGRGGQVIRSMSERSGAKMQLGDAADPYGTKERIVNLSGTNVEQLVAVSFLKK